MVPLRRNGFVRRGAASDMAFDDPVFIGIVVAVILFFFFIYLMVRRTLVSFREGVERGRNQ